jgi:hypothetical protein
MPKHYPYKGHYTRICIKNGKTIISHSNADFLNRKDFLMHLEQWNYVSQIMARKNPNQIYKYYETEVYQTLTGV